MESIILDIINPGKDKEKEMYDFTPQEITRFKQFLSNQEPEITIYISNTLTKEIISLVFQLLQKQLDLEFIEADKEMVMNRG